jgi:protein SPA2
MRGLQKELDELRRDKERDARRAREDAQELMLLRDRCERLESERAQSASGVSPPSPFLIITTGNLMT